MHSRHRRLAAGAGVALAACLPATHLHAQGVATDAGLQTLVVTGPAEPSSLPPRMPNSSATRTAEALLDQGLLQAEDALLYAPNTTVRKRYPGDRNALVAGRSFGTLQPSRALVYADGYLLSNFLGRFDAPRWNMISPDAIARVDVLYGPFSALLPGNSIGSTVAVTQRRPAGFELGGRVAMHQQRFDLYGRGDDHAGQQASGRFGHRIESGLWLAADVHRQHSVSQPMQYLAITADDAGNFPAVEGEATPVSGIVYDTDPRGLRRAVLGAHAGAIDDSTQESLNLRGGVPLGTAAELSAMASWWSNRSRTSNLSFLRDTRGGTVWSGVVSDGERRLAIPAGSFAPTQRAEDHRQLGATLKTRHASGWNGSLVLSDYRILHDALRQALLPEPEAAAGGPGSVTRRDGTGWRTAEVQATWTPTPDDWTRGRHALAFGLHRNAYRLDQRTAAVAEGGRWQSDAGTPSQAYGGRTEVVALYAQDVWQLADDWRLTTGWRAERFRALEGRQMAGGIEVQQPARRLGGQSPKVSLAWMPRDDTTVKLGLGRGVRFPNVEELYNGTVTPTSVTLSDPDLRPEVGDALELSVEHEASRRRIRLSWYQGDVRDAILRQSTTDASRCGTTAPSGTSVSCVQNVERVLTQGLEVAGDWAGAFGAPIDLDASLAYTLRSEVLANRGDPAMVGRWWLRVPRTRATLQATWRAAADWTFTAGWRHQGRAYNDPYNLDIRPDVYGGVSRVDQLDLRLRHALAAGLDLALGVLNVTDQRAYQSHPYPGRTLVAELRFSR